MEIYTAKVYASASDFISDLADSISKLESLVNAIDDELKNLKPLTERYKKLQELLKKFGGGAGERGPSLEITGLRLYIDPNPLIMYEMLEESYRHMADLLTVMKKVKDVVETVIKEGGLETLKIVVQFKNGIPAKIAVVG
jgi:hypothetical protein